jgi:hypothetical protein
MAQKTAQFIIGQLLTDEELRATFLDRPVETLAALRERGVELTSSEIIAIAQTDQQLWRLGPVWIDLILQR